jgi:hypothetical protein
MDSQDENSELGHEGKAHPRQGVAAMTTLAELRLAWQASGLHLSDEFLAGMLAYICKSERSNMQIEQAAKIAHEVNRAFCLRLGDTSQPAWEDAPDWQKRSAIDGITLHWKALARGEELPPSASHNSWLAGKEADGWKYGAVKDPAKKEHPCFVPYEDLPPDQQTKDYLFGAVAHATFEEKAGKATQ